jgi:hypothetical protein
MILSRLAPLLLLAVAPAASPAAPPLTAEQALENHRIATRTARAPDCARGGPGDDIVVCGRSSEAPDPYRLPLPTEPEEGTRIRGEAVSAAAIANRRETCSTVGPHQRCSGGLPILAIAAAVAKVAVKAAEHVLDPDE